MRETVSLAGRWRFRLDPAEQGQQQAWFGSVLREQVVLPGTTDENRKGERNPKRSTAQLSRVYEYIGKAWYQRTIEIPESWRGRQIALFLERSKQTQVWVDRSPAGNDASLCATHQYDLTPWLTPGRHTLTICVDNRDLFNLTGSPHAIGEHTQGNWNGIIGRIELVACAPVWLQQVSVYPDAQQRRIRAQPFAITREIAFTGETQGTANRRFGEHATRGRERHAEFGGEEPGDRAEADGAGHKAEDQAPKGAAGVLIGHGWLPVESEVQCR